MQCHEVIRRLRSLANPDNAAGMVRYGINTRDALGISIYTLRDIAKEIGTDHTLALELWESGVHEARILASIVDDPSQVTEAQMEHWVREFDSWDVCDQVTGNLFDKTPFAYLKAAEWSRREEEFVKRAGFAVMAALAVQDKQASDEALTAFLPLIREQAHDERNFVKKAVNWALRNIGKRNITLNVKAIALADELRRSESRAARWTGSDAYRELTSEKVRQRLAKKV
jgi:3-methyladenine DNA glycosylase AlkD